MNRFVIHKNIFSYKMLAIIIAKDVTRNIQITSVRIAIVNYATDVIQMKLSGCVIRDWGEDEQYLLKTYANKIYKYIKELSVERLKINHLPVD